MNPVEQLVHAGIHNGELYLAMQPRRVDGVERLEWPPELIALVASKTQRVAELEDRVAELRQALGTATAAHRPSLLVKDISEEHEDALFAEARQVVDDVRHQLHAAHLRLRTMDRLRLEQISCVLAAMVDPHTSPEVMAWWRHLERPEVIAERRAVLLGQEGH
jgi:hypothetical protein